MSNTYLTDAAVERCRLPQTGRAEISDSEPGLFLWITSKGRKSWVVIYRLANWPQYIPAPRLNVNPPKEWEGQDDNLFVVRARTHLPGQDERAELPVLMVHQRVPQQDGTKAYWCWTYYDDNRWRLLEPPEALPLYGMENLKGKSVVFLHEGAKAARECTRLAATGLHP